MSALAERPAPSLVLPTLANGEWPVGSLCAVCQQRLPSDGDLCQQCSANQTSPSTAEGGPCVDCGSWGTEPLLPFGGGPYQCQPCYQADCDKRAAAQRHPVMPVDPLSWEEKFDRCVQEHGVEETMAAMQLVADRKIVARYWPGQLEEEHLPVPDHAPRSAKIAAHAVRSITSRRRAEGWSFQWCTQEAPLGAEMAHREALALGYKIKSDRTIRAGLRELTRLGVLTRVGQLADWIDINEQKASRVHKSGALQYKLNLSLSIVGISGFSIMAALLDTDVYLHGANRTERRAQGALRWAVKHAKEGIRNVTGYRLVSLCRDAGLTEDDARPLMREYAASVCSGSHSYTLGEAMLSLRSAYKR